MHQLKPYMARGGDHLGTGSVLGVRHLDEDLAAQLLAAQAYLTRDAMKDTVRNNLGDQERQAPSLVGIQHG
ncbi:MAG: hypothetical protein ACJ740_18180 [Gaiellales bacterium]